LKIVKIIQPKRRDQPTKTILLVLFKPGIWLETVKIIQFKKMDQTQ